MAFGATFIASFGVLSVSTPGCAIYEELWSKMVTAFEFSAALMLLGIAIYSALQIANCVSNSLVTAVRCFLVAFMVVFFLLSISSNEEEEDPWKKTGGPVILFKDLK